MNNQHYAHTISNTIPLCACEAPNFAYNQMCKEKQANPTMKLITSKSLGVPRAIQVVNLSAHVENGPMELSSDSLEGIFK
jgi:hypothetical protein